MTTSPPSRSAAPPPASRAGTAPRRHLLLACRRLLDGPTIATTLGVHPTTIYNWSAGRTSATTHHRDPVPPKYGPALVALARTHGLLRPDDSWACRIAACPWVGPSYDALELHDATDHVPPSAYDDVLANPYRVRAIVTAALDLLAARYRRRGHVPPSNDILYPVRAALTVR